MPLYGKNHLKVFFSRTKNDIYQVCLNDEPRLTFDHHGIMFTASADMQTLFHLGK